MTRIKGFAQCNAGTAAIEFAIIGLVMVVACLGIVEFGRGLYLRNQISFAADMAARKVLMDPSILDSKLETEVRSAFAGPEPELLEVTFGTETVDGMKFRTVLLRFPFSPLIPGLGADAISLSLARRIPIGA